MREHDSKGLRVDTRVDVQCDSDTSRTASENTLTPASVTPASPLPWSVLGHMLTKETCVDSAISDAIGYVVADCHDGRCEHCDPYMGEHDPNVEEADAAYIVRAANAFPDLLAVLKVSTCDVCGFWFGLSVKEGYDFCARCRPARAAIIKAEGSTHGR